MKAKITFLILSVLFSTIIRSQSLETIKNNAKKEVINANEKTKSGNYKDILTSFLQLASTNLTGEEKTIDFNSTLFAVKVKANPELNRDDYYVKERLSRNLQFNFKANLDKNFKYTGFTGGLTFAIVNNRDKSVAEFGKKFDTIFTEFNKNLSKDQAEIIKSINKEYADRMKEIPVETTKKNKDELEKKISEERIKKFADFNNNIINPFFNRKEITSTDTILIHNFNRELKAQNVDLQKSAQDINDSVKKFYKEIESKALWTISADGTANKNGKFNQASFGTIYLKGNKEAWNEIDIRAKLTYADTLITEHLPRTGLNAKAGINFKIGKTPQKQSYFEIKALGEYNKIFNNVLPDEDEEVITANAEVRIRIADDLWIPFVIKYDIENSNFLGFLNLTYNFGI
ncbi:MAG: hypothetical protein QG594_2172 [Bacteroidota bacterium]|nr:hypothetical protein [Bacteroidota bacterium]